ncbi:hypothetical protein PHET_04106 [Paragonimus heterotremus]|uniref:Uncharacterized protein n=1 Tax=Paragonimus heterotremus TaxID=100268 RepID=A0A8J4X107_9TREM|nr:hypothetical protein PHET_04106 [Paragonimus heterotremus]
MDFSGRFPVSLLAPELRKEFTTLLTAGRLARIRDALHILRPVQSRTEKNHDYSSFLLTDSDSADFKRPNLPVKPGVKHRETWIRMGISEMHRSSTLRSSAMLSDGLNRRSSVLMNLLQSAAHAAQGLSNHEPIARRPPNLPRAPSLHRDGPPRSPVQSGPDGDRHGFRGQGAADTGSLNSSGSSDHSMIAPYTTLPNRFSFDCDEHESMSNTSLPVHKFPKQLPMSADPKTLATLLSLLPPSPGDRTALSGKQSRPAAKLRKAINLSRSSSLTTKTVPIPCPTPFSQSALIAETDMRMLVSLIRRRPSITSLTPSTTTTEDGPLRKFSSPGNRSSVDYRLPARCRSVDYAGFGK